MLMNQKSRIAFFAICILLVQILIVFGQSSVLGKKHALLPGFRKETIVQQSVSNSLEYLRNVMDKYHNRFPVYDDVSSPGNHFFAFTKIPNENAAVDINGSYAINPHSGATAIRCDFRRDFTGMNFGGFYFQNGILPAGELAPLPNFGTVPNAGIDLTGAAALRFWVQGDKGGEVVEFFMGGVGRNPDTNAVMNPCVPGFSGPCPAPDSTPVVKITKTLTNQWELIRIDLTGKNLGYVLGGFGWLVSATRNTSDVAFYVDDIEYELNPARREQRLNEPRLLKSFTTLPVQPDAFDNNKDDDLDFVLRNTAFVYDNALALLAFIADGSSDSLRRAKLIGDALVYAFQHDRTFDDGRLRTAYSAGDIALPHGWTPNGRTGTVPSPGFYDENQKKFFEVEQSAVDTGNNAWGMIALLALYQKTGQAVYLDAARRIGNFIHGFRNDSGLYQGFQGGIENPEAATSARRVYASTEHNLDIYAAFSVMFQITHEPQWQNDAQHARKFVTDMLVSETDGPDRGCCRTGTTDPNARNEDPSQLPLDVHPWGVLSLPDALTIQPHLLECVERNHRTMHHEFSGFDFNADKDGVWLEGTGHMAVAYAWTGALASALGLREQLNRAQQDPSFGDGPGTIAACHDGVTSGFGFKLFRRLHVGATAWNVFGQLAFNPYYQLRAINISGAAREGKALIVSGENFDDGAVILLNDEPQKTRNDEQNPAGALIAKKAGKQVKPGQTVRLRVRNSDGRMSPEFLFHL